MYDEHTIGLEGGAGWYCILGGHVVGEQKEAGWSVHCYCLC